MPLELVDMSLMVGGKEHRSVLPPNRFSIISPGTVIGMRQRNSARVLHVFLKSSTVAEVAADLFGHDERASDIATVFNVDDPTMTELLHLLLRALLEPADHTALKVDYLSRGLTADVLVRHTVPTNTLSPMQGPLSASQVRRIADYIHEHLSSDLSLAELALVAGMSRTIFVNRFKASFRQTPHQYVIENRIRRAQELLAKTDLTMPKIAEACGFSDQAHFSMRFKKMTKLTPSAYRRDSG
jgi:AraC family transcriptional regulator